jgi:hypothetical protein
MQIDAGQRPGSISHYCLSRTACPVVAMLPPSP